MRLSRVPSELKRSGIRRVMEMVWKLEAQGKRVVSLCVGQPDFPAPALAIEAAQASLANGDTKYISNAGLPSLRDAVAAHYTERASSRSFAAENVLISHGSMFSFSSAFMALLEPGDEVLLPDPGFPNYAQVATLLGAKPVFYPLRLEDGWQPRVADIDALRTERTKLAVVCTPGNPTGAVLSASQLQGFADWSSERRIPVLSDEIYDRIAFDSGGAAAPTMLATKHEPELTMIVSGVAKAYAMTGFRVGWLVAAPELIELGSKLQEPYLSCGVPFAQAAAEAVLRGPQEGVAAMAAAYERRRDLAVEILRDFGIFEYAPQGAFYLLVHCGGDSLAFCDRLLEARRVAVAPGSAFGDGAREYVRVSLASDDDAIREGLTALCEFRKEWQVSLLAAKGAEKVHGGWH